MTGVLKTVGDYFELDKYQNEIAPIIKEKQDEIKLKISLAEQSCLNQYIDNEFKYVECMKKLEERSKRALQRLDYGIMYWKQKTYECFHNEAYKPKEVKSFNRCKPAANTELQEIFNNFTLQSLE